MEQKRLEILQMLEGKDEAGAARAVCNVSIRKAVSETEWENVEEKSTLEAVVSVCVTAVWVAVNLEFEDRLDYDYLQMAQVCMDYSDMVRVGEADNGQADLVLALTPIGEYDYVLIGRNGFWSFMPERPDGYCNTIRFIFPREQVGMYELSESGVEQMVAEAEKEVN